MARRRLRRWLLKYTAQSVWTTIFGASELLAATNEIDVRLQIHHQSLQIIPGDIRLSLQIIQDTSLSAQALKDASPDVKAVPIIYIVAGIVALPVVYRVIRSMLLQAYYGGVIIDTRSEPASIRHDKAVPSGMVFVIGKDGKVEKFDEALIDEKSLSQLLRHGRP